MITILIDHNIEGQALLLSAAIKATGWADVVDIRFVRFVMVGLRHDSSDREVWSFHRFICPNHIVDN